MSHARPALDLLAELRRGRLSAEMTDALHDLVVACQETGKKGTFVLKLTISPEKTADYETPRITVTDQINTAKPRRSVQPSTFFLTDDGNPVRRDPNNDEFPSLREVADDPAVTPADTARKAN
jgi:hypothetical protein